MINSQSTERYLQLERELLQSLPTADLERLHKDAHWWAECQAQRKYDVLLDLAIRTISISVVVLVLGMFTLIPVLFVKSIFNGVVVSASLAAATGQSFSIILILLQIAWFCIVCYLVYESVVGEYAYPNRYSCGFVFTSGDSTFAVHQWEGRPEDHDKLRYWKEAVAGMHGPVTASIRSLTEEEKKFRWKLFKLERGDHIFKSMLFWAFGLVFLGSTLVIGIVRFRILYAIPLLAIAHIVEAWHNARKEGLFTIDPRVYIYTENSYHLLLKILDSRVPGPSRRL